MKTLDVLEIHRSLVRTALLWIASIAMLASLGCGGGKSADSSDASGNTILPSAPTLETPTITNISNGIVTSNVTTLTVTGTCKSGSMVWLGGDDNQQSLCASDAFSFSVEKPSDGTYSFNVRQTSLVEHPSEKTNFTWVKSNVYPANPILTSPTPNPLRSNASSITIAGSCENGATVNLSGDFTSSVTCSSSSFSFNVPKSSDATYVFSVSQTNSMGNVSGSVGVSWTRDTSAPSAPTIVNPASNPFTSNDTDLTIDGACESGTTVTISGDATGTTSCSASSYSFLVSKSSDATYSFSIKQTDQAGNQSAATAFQWVRLSSAPSTPVISAPAPSPFYSNTSSIDIAGSCDDGNTVELNGDATDTATCASSSFTFTVNKGSDNTYNFSVRQMNGSSIYSGSVAVSWVRDTVSPSNPTVTSPASSPYRSADTNLAISGACENGANVSMSGSATGSVTCSGGAYSFNISKNVDGTYNFTFAQTDRAGNSSGNTSFQWVRDTVAPSAPTITSPATNPAITNGSTLTVSGACETNAAVTISGDKTGTTTCAAGAYSINVSASSDGTYNMSVSQKDLANNQSTATSLVWTRDTGVPAVVTVTNPASNPYTSADTNLTISGACESGATVNYSGSATGTTSCTAGTYSFVVTKNSDATYNFTLNQTDVATNTSSNTSFQWIRLSSIPSTPTITTPAANPVYTNGSSLTIAGACTTGNTVELSGDSTNSTTCASSAYSFSVSKSSDATYNFSVRQKNVSNIYSAAAALSWVRDTVVPATPTVTSPVSNPLVNNANSVTITGACETNATVSLTGGATASTTCSASSYSLTVTKSSDGTYNFSIRQTDLAGNASGTISRTWTRDTVVPASPNVTNPVNNPEVSGDTNLTISGDCEPSATVTMAGSASQTTTCTAGSAFSFTVSKSSDGTYNFNFTQTDVAGNTSSVESFQWIRDTSIPFTPGMVSPASTPYRSNTNTVTIKVTCDSTLFPESAIVHLAGDVSASDVTSPAGILDQDCTSSPVTFVVQKTSDGTYNFTLSQENPNNDLNSANVAIQWVRDTVVPSAPVITTPGSSPFTAPGNLTLSGTCESLATVNLTGDSTQSQTCSGGNFSFSIVKSTDATYNFTVKQTDLAGNVSSADTQQWIRDANSVQPPTITTPSVNPFLSNSPSLTLSGACTSEYTVTVSGNVSGSDVTSPAGATSQTCVGGTYSFEISKSSDGDYTLSLKQTFNSVNSANLNFVWKRDTTAPTATITAVPADPNLTTTATFSFSSNEAGSTFECKLDTGSYASCTSPKSYTSMANGNHDFYVRTTDSAGNVSSVKTYNWDQAAYNTLALYHLNNGSATTDSSLFTQVAGMNNNLTATGSPSNNTTGKFPTSSPSSMNLGTSIYYSVASNSSLQLGVSKLTVEGWFRVTTSPGTGNYYTLVSKSTGASPNYGWEVRLQRSGSTSTRYRLNFVGSLNGTTSTTVQSSSTTFNTNTWYYYAVTWNAGTVTFYSGSTSVSNRGSATIGTVGSAALFPSTAPLRLGANATAGVSTSKWLSGALDETRISQVVRTITFPSAEFTAD